jgi:hypothetical protein
MDAPHGCDLAVRKAAALKPDFAIMGGDHVYDANAVDATHAQRRLDLERT